MAITGEAYGGSMLVQGWTTQNAGGAVGTLSPDEEQGFGANSYLISPSSQFNYIGWSMITEDAIASTTHPTTNIPWITRVFVPVSALCSKVDVCITVSQTVTHWYMGIYNAAGTQLAVTADSFATLSGQTGLLTLSWTTPVTLTGGTFYWVATNQTAGTSPTFAGCNGASAASLNAGLTVAAPEACVGVVGTLGALPSPLVFATTTLTGGEPFIGLH
jgi:hypothetical protein